MIELINHGVYLKDGVPQCQCECGVTPEEGRKRTIAYSILSTHNVSGDDKKLRIKFDQLISHDITYVGIIQTARASGLKQFPMPYAMTNCHNSLCAVGGTINEDDHVFGLSAAKRYGGIFVPTNQSVIHSYAREMMAGCGQPYPLWRPGHYGCGRRRRRACKAAFAEHMGLKRAGSNSGIS